MIAAGRTLLEQAREAPAARRRIPDAETRYSRGHRDPDWVTLFE